MQRKKLEDKLEIRQLIPWRMNFKRKQTTKDRGNIQTWLHGCFYEHYRFLLSVCPAVIQRLHRTREQLDLKNSYNRKDPKTGVKQ